jgi:hypothetical protein
MEQNRRQAMAAALSAAAASLMPRRSAEVNGNHVSVAPKIDDAGVASRMDANCRQDSPRISVIGIASTAAPVSPQSFFFGP